MDANSRELRLFPLISRIAADIGGLLKNHAASAATRPEAVLAVGLRQEALRQHFLIATTAGRVFQQSLSVIISLPVVARKAKSGAHQWLSLQSESAIISVIRGELLVPIGAH